MMIQRSFQVGTQILCYRRHTPCTTELDTEGLLVWYLQQIIFAFYLSNSIVDGIFSSSTIPFVDLYSLQTDSVINTYFTIFSVAMRIVTCPWNTARVLHFLSKCLLADKYLLCFSHGLLLVKDREGKTLYFSKKYQIIYFLSHSERRKRRVGGRGAFVWHWHWLIINFVIAAGRISEKG